MGRDLCWGIFIAELDLVALGGVQFGADDDQAIPIRRQGGTRYAVNIFVRKLTNICAIEIARIVVPLVRVRLGESIVVPEIAVSRKDQGLVIQREQRPCSMV